MKDQILSCAAVLTGDIVRSSSLPTDRRLALFQSLQDLSALLKHQYPDAVRCDLAKFRGDGWQLVIDRPQKFFEISLYIRTYIRMRFSEEELDTRIAAAVGSVEFVPEDNVSAGFGQAFTESGKKLDELKQYRMGISLALENAARYARLFDALLKSYDTIITAWTALQSQAVHLALQGLTQAEVGRRWQPQPIEQVTVNRHLSAAKWGLIKEGIEIFESETTRIIQGG